MKSKYFSKKFLTIAFLFAMVFSVFGFFGGAHGATVYSLTWEEKNLPSGTTWGVIIWNESSHTGTTLTNTTYTVGGHVYGNISFSAESGVTYLYNYTGTPWFFNSTKNSVSVSAAETYTVNFIENFTLNITESGFTTSLPIGYAYAGTLKTTTWSFNIGTTAYATNKTYELLKLRSGSYSLKFSRIIQNISVTGVNAPYPGLAFVPSIEYYNTSLTANSTVRLNYTEMYPFETPNQGILGQTVKYGNPLDFVLGWSAIPGLSPTIYYYILPNTTVSVNLTASSGILWFDHPKGYQIFNIANGFKSNVSLTPINYTIQNSTNWNYQNISIKVSRPISLFNNYVTESSSLTQSIFVYIPLAFKSVRYSETNNTINLLSPVVYTGTTNYDQYVAQALPVIAPLVTHITWNYQGYNGISQVNRNGTGAMVNVSGIKYFLNIIAQIEGLWGNQIVTVYPFMPYYGSYDHVKWILRGYVPNQTWITSPAIFSANNISTSLLPFTYLPQSNGYYNLTIEGYSYIIFNETGKVPLVFFVTPYTRWINITQSMFVNATFSAINVSISKVFNVNENIINVSNIPAGFSDIGQNNTVTYIIGLHKSGELWQEISFYNTNPTRLNISLIKGLKYRLQLLTNTTYNVTSNISSQTGYYIFQWAGYNVDPILNVSAYPVAVISNVPSAIPLDTAVILHGGSSYYNITNYSWTINGPEKFTEYGPNPSVFFSLSGIYTVSLTVTSVDGLTNTTTTTLTVVTSQVDNNIVMSVVKSQFTNGTWELKITIDAKDNVSISQITVQVGSSYVNVTLSSQVGFEYTYISYLNPAKFAYGNYSIKITAFNSLDEYNTLVTYLTFGSVNGIGILGYITTNTLLLVVIAFLVIAIIIFIYSMANEPRRNTKIKVNTKRRKK